MTISIDLERVIFLSPSPSLELEANGSMCLRFLHGALILRPAELYKQAHYTTGNGRHVSYAAAVLAARDTSSELESQGRPGSLRRRRYSSEQVRVGDSEKS